MNCQEKPVENLKLDVTVYPLAQLVKLLTNANPNTIELLGTKEEHLFIITEEGRMLRNSADLFLSKGAYASFGGYAIQQLRRLENALARGSYPQKEKEKHIMGSIERQMMTFVDRYKPITKDQLKLYIDKSDKLDFDEEIFEMVDWYDQKFQYAKENCVLPDKPDYKKINELVIEINKRVVSSTR